MFGAEPEAAAPAVAEPAAEPAAPADEPAEADDGLDDLFSDTPAEEAPATETDSIEGLFGDSPSEIEEPQQAELVVEADSIEDLFGETPSEVKATEETEPELERDSIEDLFGATPAFDAEVETVAELPAPAAGFEQAPVQVVAAETLRVDPLSSTHVRIWIDNSGSFSTEGRLIEINQTNVRLLKSNGRTCTVPNSRLSEADEAYINSLREQLGDSPMVAMLSGN